MLKQSSSQEDFDYIIAGAGCSGLSLAVHLIRSGLFGEKKILLIDKAPKTRNDRTWCFWETEPGLFEPIVCRQWEKAWFQSKQFSRLLSLAPYRYKMIRAIDFYKYCFDLIQRQPNFEVQFDDIYGLETEGGHATVTLGSRKITARYVFNSISFEQAPLKKNEYYLLQHFKGWLIRTNRPSFTPAEATLMDFRVPQKQGTTFVYVMPLTENKALVEYTLFTEKLLGTDQYDEGLRQYIRDFLSIDQYTVEEEEFGIIPMTNRRFTRYEGNIINIGTVGGQTKASSGYTFRFIQKHASAIVKQLTQTGHPFPRKEARRFHFYDSVFLDILHQGKIPGEEIFSRLFKKNSPRQVLRFLDNETSLLSELKIISSLPSFPFLRAAIRQM